VVEGAQFQTMKKHKIETVRHLIYYAYANLAMAHSAVEKGQEKYGTMNMRTIFDDEKIKLQTGQIHIFLVELVTAPREKRLNGMDGLSGTISTIA